MELIHVIENGNESATSSSSDEYEKYLEADESRRKRIEKSVAQLRNRHYALTPQKNQSETRIAKSKYKPSAFTPEQQNFKNTQDTTHRSAGTRSAFTSHQTMHVADEITTRATKRYDPSNADQEKKMENVILNPAYATTAAPTDQRANVPQQRDVVVKFTVGKGELVGSTVTGVVKRGRKKSPVKKRRKKKKKGNKHVSMS